MFMHGKFLTVAKTNKKIVNLQVHLDVLLHLKENLDFAGWLTQQELNI